MRRSHCPHCGSERLVKYGFTRGRQRVKCKECGKTSTAASGTCMNSVKIPSDKILKLIECEIEGLSLKETSYRSELSETTCFNFRQRLYSMASVKMEDVQLRGQLEVDSTYAKINLSGTSPDNMPRFSKKRGKKAPVVGEFKSLRGISHHKICIVTAIDEHDNILFRVSGLGQETSSKYEQFREHFTDCKTIISDSDSSIALFAANYGIQCEQVASGRHTTDKGNSLGDVNQLHQTLKDYVRSKHGISTRHLPGYLNWIAYLKHLKYSSERDQIARIVFNDLCTIEAKFIRDHVSKTEQPISLFEAYKEYHYGIFSQIQS